MRQPGLRNALSLLATGWLVAACLIMICFPIRSAGDKSPATLTIYFGGEGESPGLFYDRDFDFPTGYYYIDIPIWLLDLALIGVSAELLVASTLRRPEATNNRFGALFEKAFPLNTITIRYCKT